MAAHIAISKNRLVDALVTLKLSDQDDARVIAAQGYVYLLIEDYDTARELLTRAAEAGNEDAKHNLEELDKHLKSI